MNLFLDSMREVFRGKTMGRVLFNQQVYLRCAELCGTVLDLAGGENPSYYRYLPGDLKLIKTNYKKGENIDAVINLKEKLPFKENSIDNIFLFNAIYIIKDRVSLLKEINRILKNGGMFFMSTPLIVGEIPEPDDFCRLTYQGISEDLNDAGFSDFEIVRLGGRFSSAVSLLHQFYYFNLIRFVVYELALFLDKITKNFQEKSPAPFGYFCIIKKV